jgi:hypothetical protein
LNRGRFASWPVMAAPFKAPWRYRINARSIASFSQTG